MAPHTVVVLAMHNFLRHFGHRFTTLVITMVKIIIVGQKLMTTVNKTLWKVIKLINCFKSLHHINFMKSSSDNLNDDVVA